jgi:S1-C subfamily serine protease
VVAIGTALGDFQNTVTAGVVSAIHRQLDDGDTAVQDLIQTDAAINHGNSGGPLLDLNGNVIGINVAVVRTDSAAGDIAEGLGFAIPSNTVKTVVERLMGSNQ